MSHCEPEGSLALELSCPICLQLFSVPVSLPCGHIYCKACLQTAMDADLDRHRCPECLAEFQAPDALVRNFKMCSIIESYKATAGKCRTVTGGSDVISPTDQSEPRERRVRVASDDSHPPGSEVAGGGASDGGGALSASSQTDEPGRDVDAETEIRERKSELASQVAALRLKLQAAEERVRGEEEREAEVKEAHARLRGGAAALLGRVAELAASYGLGVSALIEAELRPAEESARRRVRRAEDAVEPLRKARLQAESLLAETDAAVFTGGLGSVRTRLDELTARPFASDADEDVASPIDPGRVCAGLEREDAALRAGLGALQRSLRNLLNPSEATFDLDTAHPNLVLSEDLKTASYSAVAQPYPVLPARFRSFLQVLSSQSFYGGEYRWEVELEASPWVVGVCYSTGLARSGLASALESSRGAWCLMWHENLLRAFERGNDVPLQKTTVTRRMEMRLSFRTQRLSFYNVSARSGRTHVYTFKTELTEPVHLAYRMMSGQPKARVTLFS